MKTLVLMLGELAILTMVIVGLWPLRTRSNRSSHNPELGTRFSGQSRWRHPESSGGKSATIIPRTGRRAGDGVAY